MPGFVTAGMALADKVERGIVGVALAAGRGIGDSNTGMETGNVGAAEAIDGNASRSGVIKQQAGSPVLLTDQPGEGQHTHLTGSLVRGVIQILIDGSGDPDGGAVRVRFNRSQVVAAAEHTGNPDGIAGFGCVTKIGPLCVNNAVGCVERSRVCPSC
ncbi:MAG: hypothetical protein VX346_05895 [Planctomycetota bacterium]|nr:hypothetical protein [Planctomycetota bacterium]